jgi:hypothetical protein
MLQDPTQIRSSNNIEKETLRAWPEFSFGKELFNERGN